MQWNKGKKKKTHPAVAKSIRVRNACTPHPFFPYQNIKPSTDVANVHFYCFSLCDSMNKFALFPFRGVLGLIMFKYTQFWDVIPSRWLYNGGGSVARRLPTDIWWFRCPRSFFYFVRSCRCDNGVRWI